MPTKTRTRGKEVIETGTLSPPTDELSSDTDADLTGYDTGDGIVIDTNIGIIREVSLNIRSDSGYEVQSGSVSTTNGTVVFDMTDNAGTALAGVDLTAEAAFTVTYTVVR